MAGPRVGLKARPRTGSGRPPTSFLRATQQSRSWPAGACPRAGLHPDPWAGHDTEFRRVAVDALICPQALSSAFRNSAGQWDTAGVPGQWDTAGMPSHRGGAGLLDNPPDFIAEKMRRTAEGRGGRVPPRLRRRHAASAALSGPPHLLRDDLAHVCTPHGQHDVCNELAPAAVRRRTNVDVTDGQCAIVTASGQAAH